MTKILIGPAYPLRGGIADFNEALANAYFVQKSKTKIITFSMQYPGFLFPGKTQFSDGSKPENIDIDVCINSINPFNWITVGNKIARQNPEYVVIQYWMPFMAPCLGTIARRVKKKSNAKIIAITHNIIPHEKFPFSKILTKYFVSKCDGFISLSKSVLSELEQFTSNQNKIFIPHPIYNTFGEKISRIDALAHLKLSPEFNYILFFGIIRKYKGLDILLKALASGKLKNKNIKLIVAGEFYEDQSFYNQIIDENNIGDKVIFSNVFIANSEIKYYFGACNIVAQTYRSATQSGVTQIAYHFEKPMLVTDVGGLAEIVPHQKVGYITQIDSDDVANCLADFFENNREEEFSKNVAIEKEKFGWDKMIDAIEELIKS